MVKWVIGADVYRPCEVEVLRGLIGGVFATDGVGARVRAVRRDRTEEGQEVIVVELSEPAEVVNDDELVLAVVEELYVPVGRDDKTQMALS